MAGNRTRISLERIAINIDDARIPDNEGNQPIDQPIIDGAPNAHWSSLPIKAILGAWEEGAIPAEISQTAGTYVCNHVFFGLMHTLESQAGVRGGFIHVPRPTSEFGMEQMIAALTSAIDISVQNQRDVRRVGGEIS